MEQDRPEVGESLDQMSEALIARGWSVDMIVDYGSHARGEARPDSDYDVNVYVHRDGWLYLFSEYAKRIDDPQDEVARWHQSVMNHFSGFSMLAGELEAIVREAVGRTTTLPVYITNVFDTRLMLYNLPHETWSLLELVHGIPRRGAEIHALLMSFLRKARPFHRRFLDVHLAQCETAKLQADRYASDGNTDLRAAWISSTVGHIRNSLSLLALLHDGWFISRRADLLSLVDRLFPDAHQLVEAVLTLKCDPAAHQRLLASGAASAAGLTSIQSINQACMQFGGRICDAVRETSNLHPAFSMPDTEWQQANALLFEKLPLYKHLVGSATM